MLRVMHRGGPDFPSLDWLSHTSVDSKKHLRSSIRITFMLKASRNPTPVLMLSVQVWYPQPRPLGQ